MPKGYHLKSAAYTVKKMPRKIENLEPEEILLTKRQPKKKNITF